MEMLSLILWLVLVLMSSQLSSGDSETITSSSKDPYVCHASDLICIPDSYDKMQRPRSDVQLYLDLNNMESQVGRRQTWSLAFLAMLNR